MVKTMDEIIEELYQTVLDKVSAWGYSDRYTILQELGRRITEESDNCLRLEYMISETDFAGISND